MMTEHPELVDEGSVFAGVDTHAEVHVAAVVDPIGRHLVAASFPTTTCGYTELAAWVARFGTVIAVGVEGTGAYGAGLARYLSGAGYEVLEVDRPDRAIRRRSGKSDPVDAYAAAQAAASGRAATVPKTRIGVVETIRVLRVARTGAVRARARAMTQLKSLIVTANDELRGELRHLDGQRLVTACAQLEGSRHEPVQPPRVRRLRPGRLVDPDAATRRALAVIARRMQHLTEEIDDLDADLEVIVVPVAPNLLALNGVAVEVAGELLVAAGDNPERIRSDAAFAHMCGAAPIPASSGKTQRHRLNRGGNRQANAALYRIALSRLRWDPTTRVYTDRRTKQGKTKPEIIRCLKRSIAREVFTAIKADLRPTTP